MTLGRCAVGLVPALMTYGFATRAEDDRAVGDDFHRRLRRHRGDRGNLRDALLQELAHDERQRRDVALRVALDERDVDVADEAGVGERLVEPFARFVERWERRNLHDADDRAAGVVGAAARGRQREAGQQTSADLERCTILHRTNRAYYCRVCKPFGRLSDRIVIFTMRSSFGYFSSRYRFDSAYNRFGLPSGGSEIGSSP